MNTKTNNYSLMEAVADIAQQAGHAGYYGGDSRQDIADFIEWAKEFEAKWQGHKWGEDEGPEYIEAIDEFCVEKMGIEKDVTYVLYGEMAVREFNDRKIEGTTLSKKDAKAIIEDGVFSSRMAPRSLSSHGKAVAHCLKYSSTVMA